MKRRVERLARDILDDPIRVTVGDVGAANNDIRQIAVCLDNEESKLGWMAVNLPTFLTVGPALVFVATRVGCDLVAAKMLALGHKGNILFSSHSFI
jgi:ATP-dependent RNA helicase DDX42